MIQLEVENFKLNSLYRYLTAISKHPRARRAGPDSGPGQLELQVASEAASGWQTVTRPAGPGPPGPAGREETWSLFKFRVIA